MFIFASSEPTVIKGKYVIALREEYNIEAKIQAAEACSLRHFITMFIVSARRNAMFFNISFLSLRLFDGTK